MAEATVTHTNRSDYLLPAYNQLCDSYHAIDDFRTKLLGFLPLVTGGGLVLLSGKADDVRREFFRPVGLFGILVTAGLLAYELYGIKKCHALLEAGKAMERDMKLEDGQFNRRPNNVLWVVNEPFAAAVIYPAVLAAWTYLAFLDDNPSRTKDPSRALGPSFYVLVGGFALIELYDLYLRFLYKRIRDWWKRPADSGRTHLGRLARRLLAPAGVRPWPQPEEAEVGGALHHGTRGCAAGGSEAQG
jgi:hypothetical protein